VDSTVLFSASCSSTGAASALIDAGLRGDVELLYSSLILVEVERNLIDKAPMCLPRFLELRGAAVKSLIEPSRTLVDDAALIVDPKDAPIVAAAAQAEADYLVTFDRKHLIAKAPEIEAEFGIVVTTPSEVLAAL